MLHLKALKTEAPTASWVMAVYVRRANLRSASFTISFLSKEVIMDRAETLVFLYQSKCLHGWRLEQYSSVKTCEESSHGSFSLRWCPSLFFQCFCPRPPCCLEAGQTLFAEAWCCIQDQHECAATLFLALYIWKGRMCQVMHPSLGTSCVSRHNLLTLRWGRSCLCGTAVLLYDRRSKKLTLCSEAHKNGHFVKACVRGVMQVSLRLRNKVNIYMIIYI